VSSKEMAKRLLVVDGSGGKMYCTIEMRKWRVLEETLITDG